MRLHSHTHAPHKMNHKLHCGRYSVSHAERVSCDAHYERAYTSCFERLNYVSTAIIVDFSTVFWVGGPCNISIVFCNGAESCLRRINYEIFNLYLTRKCVNVHKSQSLTFIQSPVSPIHVFPPYFSGFFLILSSHLHLVSCGCFFRPKLSNL